MAYTLTNLQDDIRSYTEVSSTVLSSSVLDTIIKNSENKIYREVDSDQVEQAKLKNLQAFATIPTFDNVSDLNNANGFTIALGQIDSAGNVTGATTSDPLTDPINYFHITSTSNATSGGVSGGGANCSAGPVTLGVVNG